MGDVPREYGQKSNEKTFLEEVANTLQISNKNLKYNKENIDGVTKKGLRKKTEEMQNRKTSIDELQEVISVLNALKKSLSEGVSDVEKMKLNETSEKTAIHEEIEPKETGEANQATSSDNDGESQPRRRRNNQVALPHERERNPVPQERQRRGSRCEKLLKYLICFVAFGFIHWAWYQMYIKPTSFTTMQCEGMGEKEAKVMGTFDKLEESSATQVFEQNRILLEMVNADSDKEEMKDKLEELERQSSVQISLLLEMVNADRDGISDHLSDPLEKVLHQIIEKKGIVAHLEMEKAYKNEEPSIRLVYDKHEDLEDPLDRVWKGIYWSTLKTACERHIDDDDKFTKLLACTCARICGKRMKQSKAEHSIFSIASRADDFIAMGNDFAANGNYIHAVMSYFTASKLYKLKKRGESTTLKIQLCVSEITDVAEEMAKEEQKKAFIVDHVIPLMKQMIEFLRSTENASHKVKVEDEARSLMSIGTSYHYCDEHQQGASMTESALELMKREFAEEAETYYLYGAGLHLLGAAHTKLGDWNEAAKLLKKSLKAYKKANDWPNAGKKEDTIRLARNDLRVIEEKLRSQEKKV